ncbi:MAG: carboxypeptidase-like regulatory domain-containing protein [Bacteroidales bacterium]|nr:MAG: carboxypeptidase-like regulatory domain-containing protein [Bacteroidales bacterium]
MNSNHKINYYLTNWLTVILIYFLFQSFDASAGIISDFNEEFGAAGDTVIFKSFTGQVVDDEKNDPVVFANVFVTGTNLGTVTNADGEFIIKVPEEYLDQSLGISHIGYGRATILIRDLKPEGNIIRLQVSPVPLKEVVIPSINPLQILKNSIGNISENYPGNSMMMTSFYRETIKKNRNYVAISEAILDVYKAAYGNVTDVDRIRIFRGRKSRDVSRMDTILFKFQGGPYNSFLLDVVKNPGEILSEVSLDDYYYSYAGMINVDGRETYIIEFDQKDNIDYPLYKGKIYLDAENLAIVGLEFGLSPKKIERASGTMIKKRPLGMAIDIVSANYLTNYRLIDDKWYLSYVRSEFVVYCKWDKKLFRSIYTVMSEMAVTDTDPENLNKFRIRESARSTDILVEQIADFEDPDFWGEYNVIKPDESIEAAINKLGRRLMRQKNN